MALTGVIFQHKRVTGVFQRAQFEFQALVYALYFAAVDLHQDNFRVRLAHKVVQNQIPRKGDECGATVCQFQKSKEGIRVGQHFSGRHIVVGDARRVAGTVPVEQLVAQNLLFTVQNRLSGNEGVQKISPFQDDGGLSMRATAASVSSTQAR